MKFLYDRETKEFCGNCLISINDCCTDEPLKPLRKEDHAFFKNNKWEYEFEKVPNAMNIFKEKLNNINKNKEVHDFLAKLEISITPECGGYVKEKLKSISILIPCYGKSDYIKKTVESCVRQTLKAYEIIILLMDEASQAMKKELENMSDNIKCICCEKEILTEARRHLVRECSTEHFVFIDADDYFADNFLEEVYNAKGNIVFTQAENFTENNGTKFFYPYWSGEYPNTYQKMIFHNATILMNKEVFNEIGFDDELWKGCEDTQFITNIFKQKKWYIGYADKTKYYYRNGIPNMANSFSWEEGCLKFINKNKDWFISQILVSKNLKKFSFDMLKLLLEKDEITFDDIFNFQCEKNYFEKKEELIESFENSQNRETKNVFNKDEYDYPENIDLSQFENKTFDVVIIGDIFKAENFIINKKVREHFEKETEFVSAYNKLKWLFDNYSCFLYSECNYYSYNLSNERWIHLY